MKYNRLRKWIDKLPVIQDVEERRLSEAYRQAVINHSSEIKEALQ